MKRIIDDHTYGDSRAEVTLAKILTKENNDNLTSSVTRILTRLTKHLNSIKIEGETKTWLYSILRKDTDRLIEEAELVNQYPEVLTYLKNAAAKRIKVWAYGRRKS